MFGVSEYSILALELMIGAHLIDYLQGVERVCLQRVEVGCLPTRCEGGLLFWQSEKHGEGVGYLLGREHRMDKTSQLMDRREVHSWLWD